MAPFLSESTDEWAKTVRFAESRAASSAFGAVRSVSGGTSSLLGSSLEAFDMLTAYHGLTPSHSGDSRAEDTSVSRRSSLARVMGHDTMLLSTNLSHNLSQPQILPMGTQHFKLDCPIRRVETYFADPNSDRSPHGARVIDTPSCAESLHTKEDQQADFPPLSLPWIPSGCQPVNVHQLPGSMKRVITIDAKSFGQIANSRVEGTHIVVSYQEELCRSLCTVSRTPEVPLTPDPPLLTRGGGFFWYPIGYSQVPAKLSIYLGSGTNPSTSWPRVSLGPTGHWIYRTNELVWEAPESFAAKLEMTAQKSPRKLPPRCVTFGSFRIPHPYPFHETVIKEGSDSTCSEPFVCWIVLWQDGSFECSQRLKGKPEETREREDLRSADVVPCRPPRALLTLLDNMSKHERQKIEHISLGPHGEWVLVRGDRSVAADGLPCDLMEVLTEIHAANGRVRRIEFGTTTTGSGAWSLRYWHPDEDHSLLAKTRSS